MMALFRVCTDSGCDLPYEVCMSRGVYPLMMHYTIDGVAYRDTLREADMHVFFQKMRDGAFPQTSAANIEDYLQFWEELFAENDLPLVHVTLGSGISSTYQNGVAARELFLQEHPNAEIHVVDSLGASISYGILTLAAADLRDEGKTAAEAVAWLERNRLCCNVYYTTGEMKWLVYGGRVSRAAATIARAINIWPLMTLDEAGKLYAREKVRGKKQVYARMAEITAATAEAPEFQKLYVCHSDCREDAEQLAAVLQERCGFLEPSVSYIGSLIGSHTGPGLVVFAFFGQERPPQKKK